MRRLRPDPVPDAVVRRLVEAANYAPSGRNLQRARWIIVRDPEQRRRLGDLNRRASVDHATAERDAGRELPHHDRERRQRMWDAVLWQAEHMHEAPVIIVACCIMDDADAGSRPVCQLDLAGCPEPVAGRPGVGARGRADDLPRWRIATSSSRCSSCQPLRQADPSPVGRSTTS